MRMLRRQEVLNLLGVSRSTLQRWEAEGRFPRRRQIGPCSVGWREADVLAFIDSLPDAGLADVARAGGRATEASGDGWKAL